MENINWFDAIALGLIVLLGLRGLVNGIIKEIFGILGLIGGLFLAFRYKSEAGAYISANLYDLKNATGVISGDTTELLAGFLAILFAVWIICLIAGEIISKFFKWSGLGFVDKIGGFLFGATKIFLILAVITTMLKSPLSQNNQIKKFLQNSQLYPMFLKTGLAIIQIKDDPKIQENIQNLKEKISDDNANVATTNEEIKNQDLNLSVDLNETKGGEL